MRIILAMALLFGGALNLLAAQLDNGVDPFNLGKGDWIWVVSDAETAVGVSTVQGLINYEKNRGVQWLTVKAGDGGSIWTQFDTNIITRCHNSGLKIFGWAYARGSNVQGEIDVALNALNLGADGFIMDAEIEYETNQFNLASAIKYCQAIRQSYPNRFLAHAPSPNVNVHPGFPYVEFGTYCDAIMPQDYWAERSITPAAMVTLMDNEYRTNLNNIWVGSATNAIKPLAPIGQGYNNVPGSDITSFVNSLVNDGSPQQSYGYNGVSFWSAQHHTADEWLAISNAAVPAMASMAPAIPGPPINRCADIGTNVTFSVTAYGTEPLSYQWLFKGNPISGATGTSYTVANVQATDDGKYKCVVSNSFGSVTTKIGTLSVNTSFPYLQQVFYDNFDTNSAAIWNLFQGSGNNVSDFTANWAFSYSNVTYLSYGLVGFNPTTNNIPVAPSTTNHTKVGLKLTVNKNDGTAATAGVSLYPRNLSAMSNCVLRFDAWINYNGGPGGGSGSTEMLTCGLNHTGTRVNWMDASTATSSDGTWFAIDGEGGSGSSTVGSYSPGTDYRAYQGNGAALPTHLTFANSGLGVNGAQSDDFVDQVYRDLFGYPNYETPGVPGKHWVQVELSQYNGLLTWRMNGQVVAQRQNTSAYTNGTAMVGYMDPYSSIANPAADNYVIIDNVRVYTIIDPPAIVTQPASAIGNAGTTANFSVSATGTTPAYQWQKNSVNLSNGGNVSGATTANLTLTGIAQSDAASYRVIISNVAGTVTSSVATLTVIDPPAITSQPVSITKNVGLTANFNVTATGTSPNYQWQKNAVNLSNGGNVAGATSANLSLSSVTSTDTASYRVIVSNAAGSVTSSMATLTVNVAPVLPAISNYTIDEQTLLTFTNSASDGNLPNDTLTYSLDAGFPAGASVNSSNGVFTWTPTEAQGPCTNTITVRVTDSGGLSDAKSFTVTVNEVNVAPVLSAISNYTVDEGTLLTFTNSATDADLPANTLTFSLDAGAPVGASVNPTNGVFTWTPSEAQGPGTYTITNRVTDNGGLSDFKSFTVTVNEVNVAPVLAAIADATVDEGTLLTFTNSASDADIPANTLTYSLDAGSPSGASVNSTNGVFTWTPSESQGPGSYPITVRVTDDGSPSLTDTKTFTVTVNEVNAAPVLAAISNYTINEGTLLTFTNSATDADLPANTLTYSLDPGFPTGASVNSSNGVFTWTPSEAQGPCTNTITVRVTDNGSPSLSDAKTFTVTVNEVNVAPVLNSIGNKTVNELSALNFTATATDADVPTNILTFSLDAGFPSGASINASSGAFSWTPTEAQGPGSYPITVRVTDNGSPNLSASETITVTVNEVNAAPTLTLGTASVSETIATLETFANGTPNGNVLFRFPSFSSSTTNYLATSPDTSWVTNNFPTGHSSTRVVKVNWKFKTGTTNPWLRLTTANAVNIPNPIIWTQGRIKFDLYCDQTIRVGLGIRETASTGDIGGNGGNTGPIEYLGVTNLAGSTPQPKRTINANAWTTLDFDLPNEPITAFTGDGVLTNAAKSVLEHLALVGATGAPGKTYNLYFDNFEVVSTNNLAVTNTIYTSNTMTFTASATDSDLPANALTFSLDPGAPSGTSINSSTGAFAWSPTLSQANTTNSITVRVTDNGSPSLSATKNFTVIVKSDPIATQSSSTAQVSAGELTTLTWDSTAGAVYQVQYKLSASDVDWTNQGGAITAIDSTTSTTVAHDSGDRFYRVIQLGGSSSSDQ